MDNKEQNNKTTIEPPKISWVKNLIIIIALLVCSAILYFMFNTSTGEFLYYNTFRNQLYDGKIKQVDFNATTIEVTYKADGAKPGWFYKTDVREETVINDINTYNDTVAPTVESEVEMGFNKTTTFSLASILYPILLLGALAFMIMFISKQIGKSNKSSMDFVKNRAKIAQSKVRFANVAGIDEEKEEVKEIVEFLKNPQKFTAMGARIPKGVILVGPPGTGKTLLAKAIAGEASVPFFSISGSDFMELFVGVGASRVRDLFEQAKKAKPCIIFIDEIDAIGRQRGTGLGGGNDEREQTLNQLLVQMDGFEANEGIILIAATNRADILDPALMRPGRFDRQIFINIPDVKGREEILKVHSKNKKFSDGIDLKQIARITSGFTGADLENLLNESAILAARENKPAITMIDITEGIDKVTMGPQKKSRIVTDRDKKITAIHEAGHAIIGKLVKHSEPIHEVSIIPRGSAAGYTVSRPDNDDSHITKGKLIDTITMMLGGRVAEMLLLEDISTGASNDISRATTIARKMIVEFGMGEELGLMHLGSENSYFFGKDYVERQTYSEASAALIDKETKKIIDECENNAIEIIKKHKKQLEAMVEVLLSENTIYSDEVDMIIAGKSPKTVIKYIKGKETKPLTKESEQKIEPKTSNETTTKSEPEVSKAEPKTKTSNKQKQTKSKKAVSKPATIEGSGESESFEEALHKKETKDTKKDK